MSNLKIKTTSITTNIIIIIFIDVRQHLWKDLYLSINGRWFCQYEKETEKGLIVLSALDSCLIPSVSLLYSEIIKICRQKFTAANNVNVTVKCDDVGMACIRCYVIRNFRQHVIPILKPSFGLQDQHGIYTVCII